MALQNLNHKKEKNIDIIHIRENQKVSLFNISLIKKCFFVFILISKINTVYCDSNNKKSLILFILLLIIALVIIVLLIIFIIWCCKRKNRNDNYFEGANYLEGENPEEIMLRERVAQNYPKALSDYLKEKLISYLYGKKFELLGTNCPICLDNFEENKSIIIIGGCLHIFHEKCLSELAEKVDVNKNMLPQFICPSCRNNLFIDIEKIKKCIIKFPNFFDDMYQNKKITKIKHIKELIDVILERKINNPKNNYEIKKKNSLKENEEKESETESQRKIKEENKDFSYDNKIIIKKTKSKTKNVNIKNNEEEVDGNDNL